MKKLTFHAMTAMAVVLFAGKLQAEQFGGDDASEYCVEEYECECVHPGWTFSGDYLSWRLTNTNLDYAQVSDLTAAEFGAGQNLYVPTDFDSGFRARIAHVTCDGWETAFAYTNYETDATAAVTSDNTLTVFPTRQHFDNVPQAGVQGADAAYAFDYDVFDAEIAKWIIFDSSTAIKVFGGFRYAQIDQNMQTVYSRPGNVDVVSEIQETDAYGIRAGIGASRSLFGGFGVSTRLAGSLLVGERDYRMLETDGATGNVEVDLRDDLRFGLPVLEAAFAVDYCCGPLQVSVGYEIENWFNLANSPRNDLNDRGGPANPVGGDNRFEQQTSDIMLDGLFIRAGYIY